MMGGIILGSDVEFLLDRIGQAGSQTETSGGSTGKCRLVQGYGEMAESFTELLGRDTAFVR